MIRYSKLGFATAVLAVVGGLFATAPSAGAAVAPSAITSPTLDSQLATVESGNSGIQRETYADFQTKAATRGIIITQKSMAVTSATTTSCWYFNDWKKAHDILGLTLWTFNVEPNWCGDGTWITSAYNNTWGTTSMLGWSYQGLLTPPSKDLYGAGWNVYENIRQGHFCFISYLSCAQDSYPYTDVEVGAGGQIYKS